uniref:Uncharacterized protein n=1 Tax=Anopheles culicifacies TaxID=139723 RepID=A0A182M092_9DIPT
MSNAEQQQLQHYNMADTDNADAAAGRLVDSGEISNTQVPSVEVATGSDVMCRSTKTSSNANSFRIEALLANKEHDNNSGTGAELSPNCRSKANNVDLIGDGFNANEDRHSR